MLGNCFQRPKPGFLDECEYVGGVHLAPHAAEPAVFVTIDRQLSLPYS